jgi:hypothetical protein
VVVVAFVNAIAASSNGSGGGSPGAFVGAGALSVIIRQRRRREAWLDHLEWHRRNGTRCPDERDGEPPPGAHLHLTDRRTARLAPDRTGPRWFRPQWEDRRRPTPVPVLDHGDVGSGPGVTVPSPGRGCDLGDLLGH